MATLDALVMSKVTPGAIWCFFNDNFGPSL
jgi:hypothetical protein